MKFAFIHAKYDAMSNLRILVWQVWSTDNIKTDRFFVSQKAALCYIKHNYGDVHLHPDHKESISWIRENYTGGGHYPDGLNYWIGWTRQYAVHLERHEIEATVNSVVHALNAFPKRMI